MLRFLISVIFVVLSFSLYSSVPKRLFINTQYSAFSERKINIEEITDGTVTEEMFYSLPKRAQDDSPLINLLISDSQVYALENCRLNVWKWENNKWVNKYKNNNKGLCIVKYYLHNNELLGFTSAGFWFSQSAIYVFSEISGNWELRNIDNEIPPFMSLSSFSLGQDTIVSFCSHILKNGEYFPLSNSSGYAVDLKRNKWFRVNQNYDLRYFNSFYGKVSVELSNTFHAFYGRFHVIVDKLSHKIYYNLEDFEFGYMEFIYQDASKGIMLNNDTCIFLKDEISEDFQIVGEMTFSELENEKKIN